MNDFIKNLRKMVFGNTTAADTKGAEYEHVRYTFESIYPDRETMERIEKKKKQKEQERQ